jgi:ribosomal protein L6P/L9E
MSRIGKLPINIPEKVEVNCTESDITVKEIWYITN